MAVHGHWSNLRPVDHKFDTSTDFSGLVV